MAGASLATVLSVAGAGASVVGSVMQAKAGKKANEAQRMQQELAERRSRRQAIRRSQIARASAVSSAQAAGGLQSSGVAGGVNSISSRLGEAVGFGARMSGLSNQITDAQAQAQRGQFISDVGGAAFNFGVNRGGLSGLFGSGTSGLEEIDFSPEDNYA